MESIEMFGRDAQLHAALRRCAPQMTAALERDSRNLPRVRVAYRQRGPWPVSWDGSTYRWRSGPHENDLLPADPEEAAAAIATVMGAAVEDSGRRPYLHDGARGELMDRPGSATRICEATNARPERWWVSVPVLSDAFQVEMVRDDRERGLWWGNQVVGRVVLREHGQWAAVGRDGVPLPCGAPDGRYATAEAALIRARDAWRQRAAGVSHDLGEDYWIEPRAAAGVDSLWLGRIHLGYVRQCPDGTCEAFTTDDEQLEPVRLGGRKDFPTRVEGLPAVRAAWRAHLRRILRVAEQPR